MRGDMHRRSVAEFTQDETVKAAVVMSGASLSDHTVTRIPFVPDAATSLRAAARSGPSQVPEALASTVNGQ